VTRPVGLRRPQFFSYVEQAHMPALPAGAIGFYNDCFMSNSHDSGTFSHFESDYLNYGQPLYNLTYPGQQDTSETSARNYTQEKAPQASQGGESCPDGGNEEWRNQDVPGRLNDYSFQYLHATYATDFKSVMMTRGMWNPLKSGLGYRYQVKRV